MADSHDTLPASTFKQPDLGAVMTAMLEADRLHTAASVVLDAALEAVPDGTPVWFQERLWALHEVLVALGDKVDEIKQEVDDVERVEREAAR